MSYAIAQKPAMRPADLRWLLIAVALHALLLTVPLKKLAPGAVGSPAQIVVRLISGMAETASEDSVNDDDAEEITQPQATDIPAPATSVESKSISPTEPRVETKQEAPSLPLIEITPLVPEPNAEPPVTTARLIGLRDTIGEKVPLKENDDTSPRRLGTPERYAEPSNWQRYLGAEALAPLDNTFNDKTVPAKVEIVDRWLAADGSHNVIVETPTGHKLCGRATAWDPMRPLIEPIMHWKICGGDGARPFDFKPREPLDRNFIIPMAKDTTEP